MTRLALLSDIHGNMTALNAVLEDMKTFDLDRVVVAGDVVNWGPHNIEVMQHVVESGWAVIRGNQELYLLDQDTPRAPEAWRAFTVARWTRQQLGARWLNVMAAWPDSISLRFPDAPNLRVVHGSPRSHFEGIYATHSDEEIAVILNGVEEGTLICAHTHLPLDRYADRWHILNPGSVGMPLIGKMEATYLILEGDWSGWRGTLRHIPFNADPVLRDFAALDFEAQCGAVGTLVLEEYRTARLRVGPFLTWRKRFEGESDSVLLDQFLTDVDPWDYIPAPYHLYR
jgi:predicted phosphodiesterase